MKHKPSVRDRREFIRGVTLVSMGSAVAFNATAQAAPQARVAAGAIIHAREGQLIPPTPDGRQVTVKVDSHLMPGVRMSMVTEDLPPNSAKRVHLHQHEDEIFRYPVKSTRGDPVEAADMGWPGLPGDRRLA